MVQKASGCICRSSRRNTVEAVTGWLDTLKLDPYGAVWLPEEEIVLGEDAAEKVLDILHSRPVKVNFFDRPAARQPIIEIAYFLAYKLSRGIGGPTPEAPRSGRCHGCKGHRAQQNDPSFTLLRIWNLGSGE